MGSKVPDSSAQVKKEGDLVGLSVLDRPIVLADLACPEDVDVAEAWVREHMAPSEEQAEVVVGLDCEWQAPWFRGSAPERLSTLQLSSVTGVLLARVKEVEALPPSLVTALEDPRIIKAGVNVRGDCERLRRDLKVKTRGVHELTRASAESSLLGLAAEVLGLEMDKDKGLSCSDWGQWPLTHRQVTYACLDAAACVDIYFKGGPEFREKQDDVEYVEAEEGVTEVEEGKEKTEGKPAAACSDFFLMMRNKSIVPPNRGIKTYPQGSKDCLKGCVFIISGVLDSMDRSECSAFVTRHGGAMRSSMSKTITHLLNDHGEIGPSKLKQAKKLGIPIIGEDDMLAMVASSKAAGNGSKTPTKPGGAKKAPTKSAGSGKKPTKKASPKVVKKEEEEGEEEKGVKGRKRQSKGEGATPGKENETDNVEAVVKEEEREGEQEGRRTRRRVSR